MITLSISVFAVLIVAFAIVLPALRRLTRGCCAQEITSEWLESFSPSSYLPMAKLLDEEDFQFLSRQPGFDFALYRKLRRERLQIFRMYLHRMIVDFNKLHFAARLVLAHAGTDQSSVLKRLLWLKLRFSLAVLQAEVSLRVCRFGIGTLPALVLIRELEAMRGALTARDPLAVYQ